MKLTDDVREDVARLLAQVCNDQTDPDAYEYVLEKLTRMAVLGTLPPGSQQRPTWSYKSEITEAETADTDDFSERKESFIAP